MGKISLFPNMSIKAKLGNSFWISRMMRMERIRLKAKILLRTLKIRISLKLLWKVRKKRLKSYRKTVGKLTLFKSQNNLNMIWLIILMNLEMMAMSNHIICKCLQFLINLYLEIFSRMKVKATLWTLLKDCNFSWAANNYWKVLRKIQRENGCSWVERKFHNGLKILRLFRKKLTSKIHRKLGKSLESVLLSILILILFSEPLKKI